VKRIVCAVLCIFLLRFGGAPPLWASSAGAGETLTGGNAPGLSGGGDAAGAVFAAGQDAGETVTGLPVESMPLPVLYERVKAARQLLLESRLEMVRQANEAKRRLEEIMAESDKLADAVAGERWKKDLEIIKESQRLLTAILSDITAIAIQGETEKRLDGDAARLPGLDGSADLLLPRDYLESLVTLYEEKNDQLAKVIASLGGIGNVKELSAGERPAVWSAP
jgi:hypothetical protein